MGYLKRYSISLSFILLLFLMNIPSFSTQLWLDEMDLTSMSAGFDRSRACLSVDGNPLRVAGMTYPHGVGTHAPSQIQIQLDGKVTRFKSIIGVDDESCQGGSVEFIIWGDNQKLWDSGTLSYGTSQNIDISLKGIHKLILQVTEGKDGIDCDHADWLNAQFIYKGKAPQIMQEITKRWTLNQQQGITWDVEHDGHLPHEDHIEMSGRMVSMIIRYGVDNTGHLTLNRHIVWPMLRTIPNNTHASQSHQFGMEASPLETLVKVNNTPLGKIHLCRVEHRGMITLYGETSTGLQVQWKIFPSTQKPAIVENITLTNITQSPMEMDIKPFRETFATDSAKGVDGIYLLQSQLMGEGKKKVAPGESYQCTFLFSGRKESEPEWVLDPLKEEKSRCQYVDSLLDNLQFECPEPVLNTLFAFAKIRAAESIFATKGGLMHGPGGGAYYAAIWANDQAEYANPFFPYLGDSGGIESALNSYRQFARFMTPEYKPVPSSIIAEGLDIWNGAGDRGDAAMIAYGASRYALSLGNAQTAEELWPSIQWCLEYCKRKTNEEGVVASDRDELEGRFPSGKANLCTSSLTYDALISAACLGESLGKSPDIIKEYRDRAAVLHTAIESYFGANISGYSTYRYYDGNTTLRAWICIPLTMEIMDRKEGTLEALFSPQLWTPDGLATEAGKSTFWDRSTLYGFRGAFAAGETEKALSYFLAYSNRRLLGNHVPYPVEAWPEGNQRHLSAESALYCRVVIEGLFGIRPTGLHSFLCQPRLPKLWNQMALKNIHGYGQVFDIEITRENKKLKLVVKSGDKLIYQSSFQDGDSLPIQFTE